MLRISARNCFQLNPPLTPWWPRLDGRVAGVAIWFYNFSTFACRRGLYVEDVFVEPAHRGLGIGRAFFRAMAQRAEQDGCVRMEWSVLDWNTRAIDFYRALGAVPMADWTVQRLDTHAIARLAGGARATSVERA